MYRNCFKSPAFMTKRKVMRILRLLVLPLLLLDFIMGLVRGLGIAIGKNLYKPGGVRYKR